MITFYGYKKCSTARKAEKYLEAKGLAYTFVDITVEPPAEAELTNIVELSGKPLKRFFNTSGVVYKEQKIKDKLPGMSEVEQIALLASNGKLMKRPIVTDGAKATVGFKEDEFQEVWG